MTKELLAPAAVLIAWTLIMLVWLMVTRASLFKTTGINLGNALAGGRGVDLDAAHPGRSHWPAHNYMHLLEQPTLFYAVIMVLALSGGGHNSALVAWAYVALRILHSIWQATVNTLTVRFTLFALSTLCLVLLTGKAIQLTLLT